MRQEPGKAALSPTNWLRMDNLGDEAEAFFRSGDEGTYEGGPATIAPLVLPDEPTGEWESPRRAEWAAHRADEWFERRRRLIRVVASIVGGLGAGLLLLSVWWVAAHSAEDAPRTSRSASVARAASTSVRAVPAVVVATPTAYPPSPVPNAVAELAPSPMTKPVAEPAPSPVPNAIAERAPAVPAARAVTARRETAPQVRHVPSALKSVSVAPRRTSAGVAGALPRGSADLPPLAAALTSFRGATAVFPN